MVEREIFFSALDIEDPSARQDHLRAACAGNAALLTRVQSLIPSHERESRFLKIPVVEQLLAEIPEVISTTIMHIEGSTYSEKLTTPDTATAATDTLGAFACELTDEMPTGFLSASISRPLHDCGSQASDR